MPKLASSLLGLVLAGALAPISEAQNWKAPPMPQAVPGEFIVITQPGAAIAARSAITQNDGVVIEPLPFGMLRVRAPSAVAAATWMEQLKSRPGIQTVEPNWRLFLVNGQAASPNDPLLPQQWGLTKISAPQAWKIKKDSAAVVVAVIDTGIDYNHPDLQANMWKNAKEIPGNGVDDDGNGIVDDLHGANYYPPTVNGNPMDDNSHGTHVAGIIGAVTDNKVGIAGTTWKTQFMAVKFLGGPNGSGTTDGAIKSIDYARKMGAHIMNNSWGGGGPSTALQIAIEAAQAEGIVFTAAAGNDTADNDSSPFYPSSYKVSNIISVLASDQNDQLAFFSNFGKTSVHLGAPGYNILSAVPNKGYATLSGTSMATPFVSGAAALLKATNPAWKAEQIKKRLMDTVDVVPGLKDRSVTGGRLNLEAALK